MQGRLCSRPHCLHAVVVSSWWRLAQQEGCRIATAIWLLRIFWRQAQSASCRVAAAISLLLVFYLAAGPVSKLQGSYRGGPSQRSQISLHIPTPKLGPSLPPRNMSTVKRTAPTGQPSSPNSLASLLLLALASALARALERPMRNMAARTPCCVVETFWESGGTSSFRWHLEAVTATPQRNSIGLDPKNFTHLRETHCSEVLTGTAAIACRWNWKKQTYYNTTVLFDLQATYATPKLACNCQGTSCAQQQQQHPTTLQPQHEQLLPGHRRLELRRGAAQPKLA